MVFAYKNYNYNKTPPLINLITRVISFLQTNEIEVIKNLRRHSNMESVGKQISSDNMHNLEAKKNSSTPQDQIQKEKCGEKKKRRNNADRSSVSSNSRPYTWFLALPSKN